MKTCVSVSEAAKIKKVTRQAIYLAIRLKRLKAYMHADRWKIFLTDLKDYDQNLFSRLRHSTYAGKPIYDDEAGYYSVDKASKMLGVPSQKIYYAVRTGILKATRKNAAWVIHVNDLLKYQDHLLKKSVGKKLDIA